MDLSIFLILLQDGITTGAIYALMALALVLVFTVTRVILLPVGEFVTYGALSLAVLEGGKVPGTVPMLAILGVAAFGLSVIRRRSTLTLPDTLALALETLFIPGAIAGLTLLILPVGPPEWARVLLALAIVTAMGPLIYRIGFEPLQDASILVLLIAAVGAHLAMTGLGLVMFGPEGFRTEPLVEGSLSLGPLTLTGQALATLIVAIVLMIVLYLMLGSTLIGKALRATAINRTGARLVGIAPDLTGRLAFTFAALIGALSGVLIAPFATIYYDTGFITGLKGFVGAIVAGLSSYPIAVFAALMVGLIEAFASFYASAFKEVIVFLALIPVLFWRSLIHHGVEEDEAGETVVEVPRTLLTRALPWVALAAAAGLPLIPSLPPFWVTLLSYAGLAAIVTLGLVVLTGVAGITSFGQAMFVGIGAYTTAYLTKHYGISPWATLPVAILFAGVSAYLIGQITLRLQGHYLPLGTLAWNIAFVFAAANLDLLNRNDGINGLPALSAFGFSLADPVRNYYVILVAIAAATLATRNLLASRAGRAIRALKGGAVAAESFGVDTGAAKILAFVFAACLAALSGWLYAHLQRAVNPTPFNLSASIEYLLMAVLGGVSYVPGAILGAVIVVVLKDKLQDVLPLLFGTAGSTEVIVFGVVLVLLLQTAREGLWPLAVRLVRPLLAGRPAPEPRPVAAEIATPAPAAVAAPANGGGREGGILLKVEGLKRQFGGLIAVNDVSFELRRGEIVGLIGPNGAGKSTTFNQITGVDRPDGGRVVFAGRDITNAPARTIAALGVARTFQHVKLVPSMSVLENVALAAHLKGHTGSLAAIVRANGPEEQRLLSMARAAIARVGLAGTEDRPATSLALGQQRIVEIARALCLEPVLIVLDEPAAGLRHMEKQRLGDLLRQLSASGLTILLVEHDMDFVMGLTDHLVVMNFGAKLTEGRPAEVRLNPAVIDAYLGGVA